MTYTMNYSYRSMAIAFVAILALSGKVARADSKEDQSRAIFESLCKNEPTEQLRTIAQARALVEFVKTNADQPPDELQADCNQAILKEAILDLEPVLTTDNPDNHCTPERVDEVSNYLESYVRAGGTSNGKHFQPSSELPKALRDFFVGYGLMVSKVCKRGLVKLLIKDTGSILTKQDFREVLRWTQREDAAMKRFMGSAVNFDDLFLVVGDHKPGIYETKREKIYIQTDRLEEMQGIRNICQNRFKPFYEKLILPLVRMSMHGFDYKGKDISEEMEQFREHDGIDNWYKLVFLCESFLSVVPLQKLKVEEAPKNGTEESAADGAATAADDTVLDEMLEHDLIEGINDDIELAQVESESEDGENSGSGRTGENGETGHGKEVSGDEQKVAEEAERKGEEIAAEVLEEKLDQIEEDKKALKEIKRTMPVTIVMSKSQVEMYIKEFGPIEDRLDLVETVVYDPKPRIALDNVVVRPDDNDYKDAIKRFDGRRSLADRFRLILGNKMRRIVRRFSWLGKLKFWGNNKKDEEQHESFDHMLHAFDKYMWARDNAQLMEGNGFWSDLFEFQNFSNVITHASFIFSIGTFFIPLMLG